MKASPATVSFNAGEWSSRLEGRSDLAKYTNACRRLRNFLPTVQGPAIKRSGTRFVSAAMDSADITRLIPFEFGTTQAYILEFGNYYCRVLKDSGHVLDPAVAVNAVAASTPIRITTAAAHGYATGDKIFVSGTAAAWINSSYFHITVITGTTFDLLGTSSIGAFGAGGTVAHAVQFATPYTIPQLAAIQYAQSADVLYLVHPEHAPRKLSRTSHTSWTLAKIAFDAPPFAQENLDKDEFMVATGRTGSVTLYSTGGRFTAGHEGGYVKLAEVIEGNYPEWHGESGIAAGNQYWGRYQIDTDLNGAVDQFDSNDNKYCHYQGRLYRVVQRPTDANGITPPLHDTGVQTDGHWNWRFVNPGYGWVQITAVTDAYQATGTVIRELGLASARASRAINAVAHAAGIATVTTATNHNMQTGCMAFIRGTGIAAMDNRVYSITSTSATTFTCNTGAAGASATGIVVQARSSETNNPPVNELRQQSDKWAFSAFSVERGYPACVAFFEDRLLWAGTTSDPQGMWLSRTGRYEDHMYTDQDDGALFLLLNTQQVNRIEWLSSGRRLAVGTAGGEFVVEAAPEGPLTAGNAVARQQTYFGSRAAVGPVRIESVTLFVQRSGRKLIEFGYDDATQQYQGQDLTVLAHHLALPKIKGMAWAQEPDRVLWVYFEDGSLAGLTYDRSQEVVGWHPHTIGGASVSVESVAVIPHPDGDRSQVWLVVKRTVNGSVVRHIEFLEETWLAGTAIEDGFFVDAGATYDGAPSASIVGLWHLLNTPVRVLADGVEVEGLSVHATLGTLTLSAAASVVQVGLAYDAELEPMLLEAGGADGTSGGKTKRTTGVVFRLEDTGSGLTYGVAQDEYAIAAATLVTDDTEVLSWPDGYAKRMRLPIKHAGPTPCTLVAMFPQVVTEDR